MHLLSDKTGEQHPLASKSFLLMDSTNAAAAANDDANVYVTGDFVAMLNRVQSWLDDDEVENELWVWNWKKGKVAHVSRDRASAVQHVIHATSDLRGQIHQQRNVLRRQAHFNARTAIYVRCPCFGCHRLP